MKFIYYKQIMELLSLKPEGLKVSTIATHIYNQRGNLFSDDCNYEKIYESVRQYLWQQNKKKHAPFVAVEGKRGYYKLGNCLRIQKEFEFSQEDEKTESCILQEPSEQYTQLSLFD